MPLNRTLTASPSTYATASCLLLRLLGVAYFFAFVSLAGQIPGLVGHDGILPAADFMADVRDWADGIGLGVGRYHEVPTLFWLTTRDVALQGLAYAGAGLALLLIAGVAPVLVLPLLWIAYLSLAVVCRDFLSFQWDSLLLETGLLAVGVAPWSWRHRFRDAGDPPPLGRWLVWWLLFRLMFASGLAKLASGDPTWRDLSALAVHYETQPLPTPVGWYMWLLPLWFQKLSTLVMFAIELVVPWLIFAGARWRRVVAFTLMGLQALIALTGNYAFFNLLTLALCVMLLDDQLLARCGGKRRASGGRAGAAWPRLVLPVVIAVATLPVGAATQAARFGFLTPSIGQPLRSAVGPLRSANAYGLFAVMTTTRPEIVVEGSMDGVLWRAYEFRHKPGALGRRPTWIAPFQPRLDWQMWFAALGRYEEELWFQRFCQRLLDGSPAVAELLATNPFPDRPPRYVRATLYRYRFADWTAHRWSGVWWVRERVGPYAPVTSLESGRFNSLDPTP